MNNHWKEKECNFYKQSVCKKNAEMCSFNHLATLRMDSVYIRNSDEFRALIYAAASGSLSVLDLWVGVLALVCAIHARAGDPVPLLSALALLDAHDIATEDAAGADNSVRARLQRLLAAVASTAATCAPSRDLKDLLPAAAVATLRGLLSSPKELAAAGVSAAGPEHASAPVEAAVEAVCTELVCTVLLRVCEATSRGEEPDLAWKRFYAVTLAAPAPDTVAQLQHSAAAETLFPHLHGAPLQHSFKDHLDLGAAGSRRVLRRSSLATLPRAPSDPHRARIAEIIARSSTSHAAGSRALPDAADGSMGSPAVKRQSSGSSATDDREFGSRSSTSADDVPARPLSLCDGVGPARRGDADEDEDGEDFLAPDARLPLVRGHSLASSISPLPRGSAASVASAECALAALALDARSISLADGPLAKEPLAASSPLSPPGPSSRATAQAAFRASLHSVPTSSPTQSTTTVHADSPAHAHAPPHTHTHKGSKPCAFFTRGLCKKPGLACPFVHAPFLSAVCNPAHAAFAQNPLFPLILRGALPVPLAPLHGVAMLLLALVHGHALFDAAPCKHVRPDGSTAAPALTLSRATSHGSAVRHDADYSLSHAQPAHLTLSRAPSAVARPDCVDCAAEWYTASVKTLQIAAHAATTAVSDHALSAPQGPHAAPLSTAQKQAQGLLVPQQVPGYPDMVWLAGFAVRTQVHDDGLVYVDPSAVYSRTNAARHGRRGSAVSAMSMDSSSSQPPPLARVADPHRLSTLACSCSSAASPCRACSLRPLAEAALRPTLQAFTHAGIDVAAVPTAPSPPDCARLCACLPAQLADHPSFNLALALRSALHQHSNWRLAITGSLLPASHPHAHHQQPQPLLQQQHGYTHVQMQPQQQQVLMAPQHAYASPAPSPGYAAPFAPGPNMVPSTPSSVYSSAFTSPTASVHVSAPAPAPHSVVLSLSTHSPPIPAFHYSASGDVPAGRSMDPAFAPSPHSPSPPVYTPMQHPGHIPPSHSLPAGLSPGAQDHRSPHPQHQQQQQQQYQHQPQAYHGHPQQPYGSAFTPPPLAYAPSSSPSARSPSFYNHQMQPQVQHQHQHQSQQYRALTTPTSYRTLAPETQAARAPASLRSSLFAAPGTAPGLQPPHSGFADHLVPPDPRFSSPHSLSASLSGGSPPPHLGDASKPAEGWGWDASARDSALRSASFMTASTSRGSGSDPRASAAAAAAAAWEAARREPGAWPEGAFEALEGEAFRGGAGAFK
jgi:hypothetical protein